MAEDDRTAGSHHAVVAQRSGDVRELAAVDPGVQVGAADAGADHSHQDLARAGLGTRQLLDAELAVLADDSLHVALLR